MGKSSLCKSKTAFDPLSNVLCEAIRFYLSPDIACIIGSAPFQLQKCYRALQLILSIVCFHHQSVMVAAMYDDCRHRPTN